MRKPRKHWVLLVILIALACAMSGSPAHAQQGKDLFDAASRGDVPRVRALLAAGADVNAAAPNGSTALMVASVKGHEEVVKLLKAAGGR